MGIDVPYRRLRQRTGELGRHFGKYLLILDRHLPALIERLEERRLRERMEIWRPAAEPASGFAILRDLARDPDEAVRFGRAYYAVQFLLLDVVEIDALRLALASDVERIGAYSTFLTQLRRRFVRLSTAYLDFLLATLAPAARDVRWALIGVGTLKDQDDIDVALVDDGAPTREGYVGELARVVSEMWKSATPLHFYLAEQMGAEAWSYPLEAYEALAIGCLDRHVVQSEIVNSTYLLGDRDLADAFHQRVVRPFFNVGDGDRLFHEVFLRGMVGEARSLLFDPLSDDRIHPKNDGLRIIKALAHSLRTIHDIDSRDPVRILDQAAAMLPHLAGSLATLKRSVAFIETVHTLFQLLHAHDEEIPVDAGGPLERVATTMGYGTLGALSPRDQLLVEYYRHVNDSHEAARPVVQEIRGHLRRFTRIHRVLDGAVTDVPPNRAEALVRELERCPGNCYWYDVIERLGEPGQAYLREAAADYAREAMPEWAGIVKGYVTWGRRNVFGWLHLNRLLHEVGTPEATDMRHVLSLAWLGAGVTSDVQTRLANLFRQEPLLFHQYLSLLQADEMRAFARLVQQPQMVSERTRTALDAMRRVAEAYQGTSRAFSRNLRAVAGAHPAYLDRLGDPAFLEGIGHGLIGLVPLIDDLPKRKEHLLLYYRVQMLRCGLLLLSGRPLDEVNRAYTDFSDLFFRSLYRLARREAEAEAGRRVETRDRTAIFTTGGRGREEAFDDDLDMIVVAEHLSEEGLAFLSRLVARMNHLLTRLGLFPHYRMADHFGAYVTPLPQIEAHLRSDAPDIYVDMTEVLELRMIEGSQRTEDRIRHHLIRDILFAERRDYLLGSLRDELAERHGHHEEGDTGPVNVKEHPGGLREIELALLYAKVLHRLDWPVRLDLFERLAGHDPTHAPAFRELHDHFVFLKRLRHLNRVLVATTDTLQPQTLDQLARWAPAESGDALQAEARRRMARSVELVRGVMGA